MRHCKDQNVATTNLPIFSSSDPENPKLTAVLSLGPSFRGNRDLLPTRIRNNRGVQDVEEN